MMLKCQENITPEQVKELQKHKYDAEGFSMKTKGYNEVVDMPFDSFDVES